ncbi:MAG: hypothetical protein HQL07_14325 [Nitrospirae bacterium]|nr:hypothetical protein [Magnetococcales bacterium]HAT49881.1 hypothetical protein [Alphaproteobacteria bacterium]
MMNSLTDRMHHQDSPWPAFMAEAVSGVLLVVVILVGFALARGHGVVPLGSPPTFPKIIPSPTVPPTVPPTRSDEIPTLPPLTAVPEKRDHEERLVHLLERMNHTLDTLANPKPPEAFVTALDRLGQQMVQATQSMITAQTRVLEEQTLNHEVLLGIKERLGSLEAVVSGPAPLPETLPRTNEPSYDSVTAPRVVFSGAAQTREQFFFQLRAALTRSQLRVLIDDRTAVITLPANLDFDRGSSAPGPRQRRALAALAHGLAQVLPCHLPHESADKNCPDPSSTAVRIASVRVQGHAAYAPPGTRRFFFNQKLAAARADQALKAMLSSEPDILSIKNHRGEEVFASEGAVIGQAEEKNGQQLDLRFFFEPPDNTGGDSPQSSTERSRETPP